MTGPARMLTGDRINVIDSFRGFALAGIVLAHMIEHYTSGMPPPELAASFVEGPLDQVIQGLMFIFVMGKFFAMFSFLFPWPLLRTTLVLVLVCIQFCLQ